MLNALQSRRNKEARQLFITANYGSSLKVAHYFEHFYELSRNILATGTCSYTCNFKYM